MQPRVQPWVQPRVQPCQGTGRGEKGSRSVSLPFSHPVSFSPSPSRSVPLPRSPPHPTLSYCAYGCAVSQRGVAKATGEGTSPRWVRGWHVVGHLPPVRGGGVSGVGQWSRAVEESSGVGQRRPHLTHVGAGGGLHPASCVLCAIVCVRLYRPWGVVCLCCMWARCSGSTRTGLQSAQDYTASSGRACPRRTGLRRSPLPEADHTAVSQGARSRRVQPAEGARTAMLGSAAVSVGAARVYI